MDDFLDALTWFDKAAVVLVLAAVALLAVTFGGRR